MITRMLAAEWAQYNINVNAIGPSVVVTKMMEEAVYAGASGVPAFQGAVQEACDS